MCDGWTDSCESTGPVTIFGELFLCADCRKAATNEGFKNPRCTSCGYIRDYYNDGTRYPDCGLPCSGLNWDPSSPN